MMALVGMFAYEFQVTLPVMARQGLHVGAAGYGFMTAAMGAGAVVGGLLVAAVGRTGLRPLVIASGAFGAVIMLAALAPTLPVELVALALVGWASISFMATGNSTLQLAAAPSMRGRVMSLWFVAFQGSTPIGGPIVGWVMAQAGARAGLGRGRDHVPAGGADGSARAARDRPVRPRPMQPRDQPSPEDARRKRRRRTRSAARLTRSGASCCTQWVASGMRSMRRLGTHSGAGSASSLPRWRSRIPQITIVGAGIGRSCRQRLARRAAQRRSVVVDHPRQRSRLRPGFDIAFEVLVGERLFGV